MKSIISILIFSLLLLSKTSAMAAKPALVLMPVQGSGLSEQDKDNYRIALQEGMSSRYKVFAGSEVQKKLQKYSAKTCDANQCLQEVAIAFQGELIGRLMVTPNKDGYFLAIEIKNIFDDRIIESRNIPCEGCNSFAVIRELKKLGVGVSQPVKLAAPRGNVNKPKQSKTLSKSINPPEEKGLLSISTLPLIKGAQIYIDNKRAGKVPSTYKLASGFHNIRIQSEEYIGKRRIEVTSGDKTKIDITLTALKVRKTEEDEGWSMPWWGWVAGAVAVGAAASGGSDDSPSSASSTTQTGEVTVTW